MNEQMRKAVFATFVGMSILLGGLLSTGTAFAQTQAYKQLSAQWWQWILSVPVDENPLLDTTGASCMVGQRGSDWFLAGGFGGGTVTRSCSVPAGTSLFFPVVNSVGFDTPYVCGQTDPIPSSVYRAAAADFINGVGNAWVTLDGETIGDLQRVKSLVFKLALPEDNLFTGICEYYGLGPLPSGIYSPAIDDGIYVRLNPLAAGPHTLVFHAENTSQSFSLDVTYHLVVVPVVTK